MDYLFGAYLVIWLLNFLYINKLNKDHREIEKDIAYLKEKAGI